MRTFYYVHTGHRIGLDRFRRCSAIMKALGDKEITVLCSDFRIAQEARRFGIENCVGLDVVRNIPQIAHHGDKLIFDSDEANPIMLEDMKQFFFPFIQVENDAIVVDDKFFEQKEKSVKMTYFFGDDDYEKDLEKNFAFIEDLNPHLQLGFYYFLDYEDMLQKKFENSFEFDEYDEMIMTTDILITCSPQAVLDSLASGGRPIYVQREDYTQDLNEKFKELNVPIVNDFNKDELNAIIKSIDGVDYKNIAQSNNEIVEFIKENLA